MIHRNPQEDHAGLHWHILKGTTWEGQQPHHGSFANTPRYSTQPVAGFLVTKHKEPKWQHPNATDDPRKQPAAHSSAQSPTT